MVKKVFAIIGIVFGAVVAFAGAVFGVMALMGKFKTPDVYPDELLFTENEIVVVDEYNPNKLYSFVLTGVTNNEEYQKYGVNQTTCYISFVTGSNLITLCNSEGEALVPEIGNFGKYKVDCNSPVYFKIVNLASLSNLNGGKVQITGIHENEFVKTLTPLTIYIDREIRMIGLGNVDNASKPFYDADNEKFIQNVTVGTDARKYFDYMIDPEQSLTPITDKEGKIVELYFEDKGVGTDYVRVTEESIKTGTLSSIVGYDTEAKKFYIQSSEAGQYSFKIAVFPSYQDKIDFDSNENNLTISNFERLQNMLVTNLTINIINTSINKVEVGATSVVFNLYSGNDYLTLNKEIADEDIKNSNLGLLMYKNNEPTEIRYNEAQFGKELKNGSFIDKEERYIAIADYKELNLKNVNTGDVQTVGTLLGASYSSAALFSCLQSSSIYLDGSKYIVSSIKQGSDYYYCTDGVLVYDTAASTDGTKLKIMNSGTYLDFYKKDGNTYTVVTDAEFNYSAEHVAGTTGAAKQWNIVTQSMPTIAADQFFLGALVINSDGTFDTTNFFKTVNVTVSEIDANYVVPENNFTLNISYTDAGAVCQSIPFGNIVKDISGSYSSFVFAVPKTAHCNVEVLKNAGTPIVFTINSVEYYIVGEIANVGGSDTFINKVQIANTNSPNSTELFLVQLKNGFEQTTEDLVMSLLSVGDISDFVGNVEGDLDITITPKQILNLEELDIAFSVYESATGDDGVGFGFYEGTINHKVTITSSINGMLYNINEFYSLVANHTNFVKLLRYSANIEITSVNFDSEDADSDGIFEKEEIVIEFEVKSRLSSQATPVYISITDVSNEDYDIGPIYIMKSSPDVIAFAKSGTEKIALASSYTAAESSNTAINIVVGGGYAQTVTITDGTNTYPIADGLFNIETKSGSDYKGFQDFDGYKVTHNISYHSYNEDVFIIEEHFNADPTPRKDGYNIIAVSENSAILSVTIGDTQSYIKVVIVDDGNFQFKVKNIDKPDHREDATQQAHQVTHSYNGEFYLNSFVSLPYNNADDMLLILDGVNIKNVSCLEYGNGGRDAVTLTVDHAGDYVFKDAATNEVLRIYKNTTLGVNKWAFRRDNSAFVRMGIKFDVVTKAGTITIQLTITSDIEVNFNLMFWGTKTIYQNTYVQLFDSANDLSTLTTEALLEIKTASADIKIAIYEGSIETDTTPTELTGKEHAFTTLGSFDAVVYVSGSKIQEIRGFEVVPNYIVTDSAAIDLLSDSPDIDIDTKIDIKAFKTTSSYVYGSSDDKSYYDGDGKLNPTESAAVSMLTVSSNIRNEDGDLLISSSAGKFSVGWLKTLETPVYTHILLQYGSYDLATIPATINNKYDSSITYNGAVTEMMALTLIDSPVAIAGYDMAASLNNANIIDASTGDIFIPMSVFGGEVKPFTGTIVYTFTNGSNTLILSKNYRIDPYTPELKASISAFSDQASFGLLGDMLDLTDIEDITDVKSIIVEGIVSAAVNGEEITNAVVSNFSSTGYINGYKQACNVSIRSTNRDPIDVYVKYTITYSGGLSYVFTKPLTIRNRQAVNIQYPETDNSLKLTDIWFNFTDYAADGEFLSGTESLNGAFKISGVNYEPVLISATNDIYINLAEDNIKKVNRASVVNRTVTGLSLGVDMSTDFTVEKIAYYNNANFIYYFNAVELDGTTVKLPHAQARTFGYIVFKITSVSGNVGYYFMYVYSEGTIEAKNVECGITLTELGSKAAIVGDTAGILSSTDFENNFGKAYDAGKVSFYTLSATSLGASVDYVYASSTRYQKLVQGADAITFLTGLGDYAAKYTTIVLSVIYNNENYEVCNLGTITLYVQPVTNEGTVNENPVAMITEFKDAHASGYKTGRYTATINANATAVINPFTHLGNANITVVIGENTTNYTGVSQFPLERVLEDTIIYATYTYSNYLVLEVVYKQLSIVIPNSTTINANIGEFKSIDDGFITTYKISLADNSDIFGNYKGSVKLGNSSEIDLSTTLTQTASPVNVTTNVNYSIDASGNLWLEFNLTNTEYVADIIVEYVNLSSITRKFTFRVKAGFKIEENYNIANGGLTASSRLYTITDSPSYEEALGSTLTVEKAGPTNGYYRYTISGAKPDNSLITSGLTIYTYHDSCIDIQFDEVNYTLNDACDAIINNGINFNSVGEKTINFVHSAEEKPLVMSLNVSKTDHYVSPVGPYDANTAYYKKVGDYYLLTDESDNVGESNYTSFYVYNPESYLTRNMFITVAKTYNGLKSLYVTSDATHENVAQNAEEYLYTYFTGAISEIRAYESATTDKVSNTYRIAIVDTGSNIVTSDYDFNNFGFGMANNPNKLNFKLGTGVGASLSENSTKITFSQVSQNTPCSVYIYNDAGVDVGAAEYKFQIMASDDAETLDYSTASGLYVDASNDYISFTDYENEDGERKELTIGIANDKNNTSAYYLTAAACNKTDGDIQIESVEVVPEPFIKTFTIHDDSSGDYTLILKVYGNDRRVTCKLLGNEDIAEDDQVVFTISLFGVSDAIVENLELVFTNVSVESNYSAIIDDSIFAGYSISLDDGGAKAKIAGASNSLVSLNLNLTKSSYNVKDLSTNSSTTFNVTRIDNDLFEYFPTQKIIQTNSIGNNEVVAYLVFDVKFNNYDVKQVAYNFKISRNYQIVVNGISLESNGGNNEPETNFTLTNVRDLTEDPEDLEYDNFSLSYTIANSIDLTTDIKGTQYKVLAVNLYRIHSSASNPASVLVSNDKLSFSLHSNHSEYVSVNGQTITFIKDFSGDIEIKIEVANLSVGKYYVIWTIHVTGVADFNYVSENPDYERLEAYNTAFTSGTEVNIVNGSVNSEDVGIVLYPGSFYVNAGVASGKQQTSTQDISVEIRGKYIKSSDSYRTVTNQSLFDSADSLSFEEETTRTISAGSSNLTLRLPSVPSSPSTKIQVYYVIYKLTFTYLEQDTEDFYVAYKVMNIASVEINNEVRDLVTKIPTIDMDKNLADSTNGNPSATGVVLDLFYYSEWFDINDDDIEDANEKLYLFEDSGEIKYSTITDYTLKADGTLENNTDPNIVLEAKSRTKYYNKEASGLEINSLFVSSHSNISSFKTYLEDVYLNGYIVLSNETNEYHYPLIHIADGRFGINLCDMYHSCPSDMASFTVGVDYYTYEAGVYKMVDTAVVTTPEDGTTYYEISNITSSYIDNEFIGTLSDVINGVKVNTTDFILTTENMLEPASSDIFKVSDIFMEREITVENGYTLAQILNTRVIGVVDSDDDALAAWVTGASDPGNIGDDKIATIKVDNGSGTTDYELLPVTYQGDGGTDIYSVSKTFYIIRSAGEAEIVVRDYSVGIESSYFTIDYINTEEEQQIPDGAFKVYTNETNGLNVSTGSITNETVYSTTEIDGLTLPTSSSKADNISISTSELITYKANNPTLTKTPTITYILEVSGVEIKVAVRYILPALQTAQMKYKTSHAITNMADEVDENPTIAISADTTFYGIALQDIVSVHIANAQKDYVLGSYYVRETGEICLNAGSNVTDFETGICKFFTENENATYLSLEFTATIKDGSSFTFNIVVIKEIVVAT